MKEDIQIQVDDLAIAYAVDSRRASLQLSWGDWRELFSDPASPQKMRVERSITSEQRERALTLKSHIEASWNAEQERVVTWLEELTGWPLPPITIRICVVPFHYSQVPFPGLPLIVLGHIREGWHYPETIAHELAHVFFNYYTEFSTERVHPLVQLIEEEIAVRLNHRPSYFSYDIPEGAYWVEKAQQLLGVWKEYIDHREAYRSILDLMDIDVW
jgi:hypothetical protein